MGLINLRNSVDHRKFPLSPTPVTSSQVFIRRNCLANRNHHLEYGTNRLKRGLIILMILSRDVEIFHEALSIGQPLDTLCRIQRILKLVRDGQFVWFWFHQTTLFNTAFQDRDKEIWPNSVSLWTFRWNLSKEIGLVTLTRMRPAWLRLIGG